MRIAIVDDISEERTLLRNRLESQFSRRNVHVDIFEYENGETFLTAAKECPFTVVFLDIYMNGSNGIDTAKELRRSDTDVKNSGNPDSTCNCGGQIYTCGVFYHFVPDMDTVQKSVSFYFFSYGSACDIYEYP